MFRPMLLGYVPAPLAALMQEHGRAAWPKVRAVLAGAA
jgi:hypothetical protein